MKRKYIDHEEYMVESLKDPEEAASYLTSLLEDDGEELWEEVLLIGLRQIAKAHGFSEIADKTGLGRESLYKSLSKSGNPKITTVMKLIRSMGLKITVEVDRKKAS